MRAADYNSEGLLRLHGVRAGHCPELTDQRQQLKSRGLLRPLAASAGDPLWLQMKTDSTEQPTSHHFHCQCHCCCGARGQTLPSSSPPCRRCGGPREEAVAQASIRPCCPRQGAARLQLMPHAGAAPVAGVPAAGGRCCLSGAVGLRGLLGWRYYLPTHPLLLLKHRRHFRICDRHR